MVLQWKHPFTGMICGSTGSGKTQWTLKFLKHLDKLVDKKIEEVVWCYGVSQDLHKEIPKLCQVPVRFFEGVPDLEEICAGKIINRLIVLDDLFRETNDTVIDLFTRSSHHRAISVLHILQNVYYQKKGMREISLNTQYCVVFFNARDRSQINYFCRQIDPQNVKFLIEAFRDATSKPHGYLLFDLKQGTAEHYRYRTNIFPGEQTVVYIPKNTKL